ncbi:PEP-CTERM sorting domain-containing protein [Rubritalea marina]|uniref:PEP-CTERM sorting domain-containing protein n=1 Tax=Rubritalea marina TaxID=361055 RepID=UPI0003607CB5|nr:PEP-CTERM sorting domain-containing protein [Rubritalea marina]
MTHNLLPHSAALALAIAVTGGTLQAATISTFNQASDLTLSGSYEYLIDIGGGTADRSINGYTFQADDNNANVSVAVVDSGGQFNWATTPEYGSTASDNDLELMMHNTALDFGSASSAINIDAVISTSQQYELVLYFSNNNDDPRSLNVVVEGTTIESAFQPELPTPLGTGATPTVGTMITHTFTSTDTNLDIDIVGNGAVIQGFTLQAVAVPEPSSAALIGLGGLTLLARRRR